ncbi:MAG TPA: sulfotransferase [Thermoanaerobaculia bacterium]|nr:sulfotransferase [Thermoanaerobaculia bacterium]
MVFLISQPRAGSTLLQRMLARHPRIETASETWLLLRSLYWIRHPDEQASYGPAGATAGTRELLGSVPDGDRIYFEAVRRFAQHLYDALLDRSGRDIYLDKTPRYGLILPELAEAFPRAAFILLLRNPLAVLSSMLTNWSGTKLPRLVNFRLDLLETPRNMIAMMSKPPERCVAIRYEAMVREPAAALDSIGRLLGIDTSPAMIDYGADGPATWSLGDREVNRHARPIAEKESAWQQRLGHPQVWRLLRDYADTLGEEMFNQLGYDWAEQQEILARHRPSRFRLAGTVGLDWTLHQGFPQRMIWEGWRALHSRR